jgi:hypothetical protein
VEGFGLALGDAEVLGLTDGQGVAAALVTAVAEGLTEALVDGFGVAVALADAEGVAVATGAQMPLGIGVGASSV